MIDENNKSTDTTTESNENPETSPENYKNGSQDNVQHSEVDDLKEQVLRLAAEVQNVKKRAEKERIDALQFSISNFAKDILLIRDSLQMALNSCSDGDSKIIEGIKLTLDIMDKTLKTHGITMLDSIDKKFDPNFHQAIKQVDSDKESGTVISVMQEGFLINKRLLRPALVSVAR